MQLPTLWIKGIFFYNQAIPFIFTSNLLYWLPNYYYVRENMESDVKIFYYKTNNDEDWRFALIKLSHIVPIAWVCFEMILNKIRIPWHHFIYNMIVTGVYFFVSYLSQILNQEYAVYQYRLNWNCIKNFSYLINKTDETIYSI